MKMNPETGVGIFLKEGKMDSYMCEKLMKSYKARAKKAR